MCATCCPHGPDDQCTCDGCWACDGHVVGCTCDIAWDCEHDPSPQQIPTINLNNRENKQ